MTTYCSRDVLRCSSCDKQLQCPNSRTGDVCMECAKMLYEVHGKASKVPKFIRNSVSNYENQGTDKSSARARLRAKLDARKRKL